MKRVLQFTVEVHEGIEGEDVQKFLTSAPLMYLCANSGCTKHGSMVLIIRNTPDTGLDAEQAGCLTTSLLEMVPL